MGRKQHSRSPLPPFKRNEAAAAAAGARSPFSLGLQERSESQVAFPTGGVLPGNRRGGHMAGVKRWLWQHEIQSVETGSREKVA